MEGGLANDKFTWYERGYRADSPSSGLPKAGTRQLSEAVADHEYQFAPSYTENNAVLIDADVKSATLVMVNPSACVTLSFLTAGGNGGGKVAYTIHHQDGTSQAGSFICVDWINGFTAAYTGAGRIDLNTYTFNVDPGNPRLYPCDVSLTNIGSPVTSIDFAYVNGAGHSVIFAVSGCTHAGAWFNPLLFTDYNQDIVVEASSTYPSFLGGFTTAAMDDGSANSGSTFYEQGYYPPAPTTGLPPAGATIAAVSAPDHRYTLAPSYTNNNVVLIDRTKPTANLMPVAPARYARLSFLTSAAQGPATNRCIVQHSDGTSETNNFVVPDWFDTAPRAFGASGRVMLNRRLVDSLKVNGPNLFAADLALVNTVSPVTNLVVSFAQGGLNSHVVIFAVSGSGTPQPPVTAARLSVCSAVGGGWLISSTAPGRLQSTAILQGDRTMWKDEGQITTNVRVNPGPNEPAKFYRVASP